MPQKVLVTLAAMAREPGRHTEVLNASGCEVRYVGSERPMTAAELIPLVGDVDAIIAWVDKIDAAVFAAAPHLKVISRHGVGYDSIDLQAATQAGVVVCTTPGANHVSVAELAFGLMLSLARRIPQMNAVTHAGGWSHFRGVELAGKTLGIVGMGRIGKTIAVRARAFEMEVVAYDVFEDTAFAERHGITYLPFPEVLRRGDFVTLHCPSAANCPPIVGEEELRLMKPTAFLINTARGSLVDDEALYNALTEGRLAGAAMDVFRKEPPGLIPLLTLDNVIATPHVGGTHESNARAALIAADNILQVLRGERCPNCVNPEVYERGPRQQ